MPYLARSPSSMSPNASHGHTTVMSVMREETEALNTEHRERESVCVCVCVCVSP